jgi:hypothetical protein
MVHTVNAVFRSKKIDFWNRKRRRFELVILQVNRVVRRREDREIHVSAQMRS